MSLNNLISHYFSTGQDQKVLDALTKLESEAPKNIHEQAIIFQKVSINRLVYYMGKGMFEEAKQMIPSIEEGLQRFKIPKATKMVIIANVSILFFITADHNRSNQWLDKIIKDTKSSHRLDVQRIARLFYIVNLIERETDYPVIDNFCRATNRFLKISGLTDKKHFEYNILIFLRKYINVPSFEQKVVLQEFKKSIENVKNNPREKGTLGLDEFYLWIRNKLENKPVVELIKEDT